MAGSGGDGDLAPPGGAGRVQVSVDLQSPLPEKPDVRLGDMTP